MEGLIATQERKMRRSPRRDGFVVVAIRHCGADDQKQDFPQRVRHSPCFAWILNRREMIEK